MLPATLLGGALLPRDTSAGSAACASAIAGRNRAGDFARVRTLMLCPGAYLDESRCATRITVNEARRVELIKQEVDVGFAVIRQDFSSDPHWPVFEPSLAVRNRPQARKQEAREWR